ncbi:Crp/Fnr family transcriptional regulator [Flammeovirga kamogawensis]|uniref:Crp/Fnr family transcriptional regulator n=1 Tax=Flammeovirga kamogawensis TaxID=373891 RepID=A0ABX8GVA1_9BACT|nr:Crp/Fnr family transcriptional regulator [Flammeovirga kamogawensis]MBB6459790.1 CRP-like cAMP-binding protein [Flammeovirga kamogawensis]QWG07152.1 Crp/Fnr family transcriptional regulator [Flammeovirga kamogawensis]TRX68974.1 Crp/Fnr family transcriptional regulator [Flammeovirga kamogawensis]
MAKDLFDFDVFKKLNLSVQEADAIRNVFKEKEIKKGEIILLNGQEVDTLFYVIDGCLRTYFIDEKGKEHTIQFAVYDWWISDMIAYFSQTKATLNIESLEDTSIFIIHRADLEKLCFQIPAFNKLYRSKLEGSIIGYQKRILGNLSQNATERYENFINQYPSIENSVKNYHLASYLGITTESLSRIRKEMSKRS